MLAMQERGAVTFDYGNNIRTVALDDGVADAFDIPGFVPEYVRPLFCEGKGPFRWVALSGDPEDIARTDELVLELFPRRRASAPLDHARARAHPLPGTAGAHLLARPGRARALRRRAQRSRRERRALGADRDRPRSSRHRQRRVAVPRDGSDEGRQRRDRRLADPQRAAQHGERRVLGVVPSRRRRRHRQLAARRPGHRRRRHAGDARAPRARAHERSGHRRRAACRRRLRHRDAHGGRAGDSASDADDRD